MAKKETTQGPVLGPGAKGDPLDPTALAEPTEPAAVVVEKDRDA